MTLMKTPQLLFEEEFIVNARGMRLCTCRWIPLEREVKGLVFLCHGYGMECTVYTRETGLRLAQSGYAVYGIDYEGHGKSEGLQAFVPDFDVIVADCATFFNSVMDREEYVGKSSFLVGESMGGAVSILITRRDPARWNGLVLVAPMLKISEKIKPAPIVVSALCQLSNVIPTWKIVPAKDVINSTFKDPIKREKIRSNPYAYKGNPRLKTAMELMRASTYIHDHLQEVSLPFLCLHGAEDTVNEPEASQKLFDCASSFDKTLKIYPGMWHGLTTGEPEDNVDLVFQDMTTWLNQRTEAGSLSPTLRSSSIGSFEMQSKIKLLASEVTHDLGVLGFHAF